jgi:small subunit ribosomal protein S2
MPKLPGAVFLTGAIEDNLALKEAKIKKVPIIALVDTNVDPGDVDYKIPANEDAVSSLQLMLAYIGQAILKGKEKIKKPEAPVVKK